MKFRMGRPRACLDAPAAESLEPGAPVAPPAPGLFLCGGEPLFRVRSQFSVYPMAALLFRGGGGDPRAVGPPPQHRTPVPPRGAGSAVSRAAKAHVVPPPR